PERSADRASAAAARGPPAGRDRRIADLDRGRRVTPRLALAAGRDRRLRAGPDPVPRVRRRRGTAARPPGLGRARAIARPLARPSVRPLAKPSVRPLAKPSVRPLGKPDAPSA